MRARKYAAAVLAAVPCACGGPSPDVMAQETTRAIYADDVAGATKYFDDALKTKVTRESVGQLSDRLHGLGSIRSFKELHADRDAGTYEFTADLDKGPVLVFVRLDPHHRISGFRIQPAHS